MKHGFHPVKGERLSKRELEIVRLFISEEHAGASNTELGHMLHVTEQAIRSHFTSLMKKAGVTNRTALALWWIRVGQYRYLVDDDPDGLWS